MREIAIGKEGIFMSHKGRRIRYRMVDLELVYMVAKGDGTDEYFSCWEDALEWIEEHPRRKHI